MAADVARDALRTPAMRLWAQRAVAPFRPVEADADGQWYIDALGKWAQSIAPLREPIEFGEFVAAPWRTIAYRSGDCDDVAAAAAAMGAIVGFHTAVAVYQTGPTSAHCVALINSGWYQPESPLAWQIDQFSGLAPFAPPSTPFIVDVKK